MSLADLRNCETKSLRALIGKEEISYSCKYKGGCEAQAIIFEKLLKKALLLFLTETRSLSPSQHGFLPRRSFLVESNLILQKERVTRLLDEGHTVDLVYLDFAFDPVNHRILLAKLNSHGIDGAVLNWIKS